MIENHLWRAIGLSPQYPSFDGAGLRLRWLEEHFVVGSPPNATDDAVRQYTQVYILALIGNVLLPDKLGIDFRLFMLSLLRDFEEVGTFSWLGIILTCLYTIQEQIHKIMCLRQRPSSLRDGPRWLTARIPVCASGVGGF